MKRTIEDRTLLIKTVLAGVSGINIKMAAVLKALGNDDTGEASIQLAEFQHEVELFIDGMYVVIKRAQGELPGSIPVALKNYIIH